MSRVLGVFFAALALALGLPTAASADFGLLPGTEGFAVAMEREGGPADRAGTHPDQLEVHLALNKSGQYSDGDLHSAELTLPTGMLANPAALNECTASQFATPRSSPYESSLSGENCPDSSQIGVVAVTLGGGVTRHFGLFNLTAPYGSAAAIGFSPFGVPIVLSGQLDTSNATLSFSLQNLSQAFDITALDLRIWGTPWERKYETERGNCLNEEDPSKPYGLRSKGTPGTESFIPGTCFVTLAIDHVYSYLTLPTLCGSPLDWKLAVSSWSGLSEERTLRERYLGGEEVLLSDCLGVLTDTKLALRTERAASATGLAFELQVKDGGGLRNVDGAIRSPIRTATAFMPEGLTINPSLGAGLGVCTQADFQRESATSLPGSGCPNNSRIGTVSADGLLGLSEELTGSVFLAEPYANPTNSLLALYITLASPRRGLYFKSYGTVEPDPSSGRLTVTFTDLPPVHYDLFTLNLREGQRSAMISPNTCGSHPVAIDSFPYSQEQGPLHDSSFFLITQGEDGGACPTGALAPFHPGLEAGSDNPNAGSYSPFRLRMTRTDAEQEITSYSATFPPGLLGKIAAIPYCPDAAIEAAKHRSGVDELNSPSCPAASSVGHTIAGYGVGGTLAYAPGGFYLSGPYHGAPLSITAIDSALVGPFDLGVVVVRSAIRIDPRTAQASIDSSGSDPIPHIIKGIPIHLRDIRVFVDRPNFTINPTSCDRLATESRLTGAGLRFGNPGDDSSATSSDRFQLSNCSAYELKPKLKMALAGPTTRGRYPQLKATYLPRPGDANLKHATVALPRTLFLAQEHIDEICTLPRFRAKACPEGSKLGVASAKTPLMEVPLKGAVYARANPGKLLPDIVADLSGRGIEIEVVGHIGKGSTGGLRASFDSLPDAPVRKFTMKLFGGKRGLLVNAGNLCAEAQHASARFIAHNNATEQIQPRIGVDCTKKGKRR